MPLNRPLLPPSPRRQRPNIARPAPRKPSPHPPKQPRRPSPPPPPPPSPKRPKASERSLAGSIGGILGEPETNATLLDLVDNLLSKGVVLHADAILALADVDLVYLRLTALLVAADRVFGSREAQTPAPSKRVRSSRG
jgi:hypothetical protein